MVIDRDYIVRVIPFPTCATNGLTLMDENGFYNIYINSLADLLSQQVALRHELKHCELDHFFCEKPVWLKEMEANA